MANLLDRPELVKHKRAVLPPPHAEVIVRISRRRHAGVDAHPPEFFEGFAPLPEAEIFRGVSA